MTHICPSDHAHGAKSSCYDSHRCRCTACCRRNSAYRRLLRNGTERPITYKRTDEYRDLLDYGFPVDLIAEMFRVQPEAIHQSIRRAARAA